MLLIKGMSCWNTIPKNMPNMNGIILLFILSSTVLGYTILYPVVVQLSNFICSFFGHFLTASHVGNKRYRMHVICIILDDGS